MQGAGRGGFYGKCFHCNKKGHQSFECPQNQGRNNRRNDWQDKVAHVDEDAKSSHSKDVERGEVLVNKKVLMSGETEPDQKRSLFCTRCKCEDKCCDVIIDGGSIDQLVLENMVKKLNLKREKHPCPYHIA